MEGIITKSIGGFFFVKTKQKIHKCNIRGKIQKQVYPGDIVKINSEDEIIEEVKDRNNLLMRPKVANVEQVILLHALKNPKIDEKLLDRFILMVESSGLIPIIVFNKVDLVDDLDKIKNNLKTYSNIGYDVFYISAKKHIGLDKLYEKLKNKISVIAGTSGSGKSTLINSIVEDVKLATNKISKKLKKGKHTTRHVELITLPVGGYVADTPGFRKMDIENIASSDLKYYFPEFKKYEGNCKFNTCSHTHEPGCRVKEALKNGLISKKRYNSYQNIYQELQNKEEDLYG